MSSIEHWREATMHWTGDYLELSGGEQIAADEVIARMFMEYDALATKHAGAVSALAKADGEVTALADALRAAGVAPTTVQAIIDNATHRGGQ